MTGRSDTEWWAGEAPVGDGRSRRDEAGPTHGNGAGANGRGVDAPAPGDRPPAARTPPPATGLKRSPVQVFIPPPEELPPFEEVVDPLPPRRPRPPRAPGGGVGRDVPGRSPAGPAAPEVPPAPDLGGRPGPGAAAPAPELHRVPPPSDRGRRAPVDVPPAPDLGRGAAPPGTGAAPAAGAAAPPAPDLDRGPVDDLAPAAGDPLFGAGPASAEVPPAPDLGRPPAGRSRTPSGEHRRRRPIDRRRLAVVYDIDGPRVRLGLAWFVGFTAAVGASPITAALALAVAVGWAARQVVRAWGSVQWQADLAAGVAALPVLAALVGLPGLVGGLALGFVVAVGAACSPDGARMPGPGGRMATLGILLFALLPAFAAGSVVLTRAESMFAALVLVVVVCAYEMADFLVGSGAGNPVEGPLAGVTTASLVALPLAVMLVEPYDAAGVALLGVTAAACPLGQIFGSALLPGAGAPAPALRRIDTLLVLAPVWAAAAGAL
ncbi:MAG: hypothetical protein FWJ94_09190 [Acidimicrobiia bacterium]